MDRLKIKMGSNLSKQKKHSNLSSIQKTYSTNNNGSSINVTSEQIIKQEKHIEKIQIGWISKDLQPGEPPDNYELYERMLILKKELEKLYYLKTNNAVKLKILNSWYE
jgi:hypothetical protein